MGWIYCLTFPNGKSYIGLTTTSLHKRFGKHKASAKDPEKRARVYAAWRKHGEPKIMALVELPNEQLAAAEQKCILAFNTKIPYGYNQSDGGEGAYGVAVSEETRRKISESQKGKRMSDESRRLMSIAKLGRKLPEETKAKIAAFQLGKPKNPDAVEKTRAANTGKRHSDEARAKMSKNRKGIRIPQEAIDRAAAKHRGRKNTPETIERMRAAALRRHALGIYSAHT